MSTPRHVHVVLAAIGLGLLGAGARGQCAADWIGGEPFPGTDGAVGASIVWDADGDGPQPALLVVAGDFSVAGGALASRIAAWNGSLWTNPFGSGLDGPVHALAVLDGALIAGGEFTHAGATTVSRVARWTGAAWEPLGPGMDDAVYALVVLNGRLYAGGAFTHAGGAPAASVAAWNGSAWAALGGSGVDGTVYALGALNGSLYVGGEFDLADTLPAQNIARWDGASWAEVGGGVATPATYAPAQVRAFLTDGAYLYVGGNFETAGGITSYGIARWDGAAWSASGAGIYRRTCIRFNCTNHPYRALALARVGTMLFAAATAPGGTAPLIFQSTGGSWTMAGTLDASGSGEFPLATIAGYNGGVYLGGSFGGPGAPMNIARLTGTSWTMFQGMNGAIEALTPFDAGLVATGTFTQIDGVSLGSVALWDGSAWHPLGAGITAPARGAATVGADLYVSAWPGGVYHWTGSAWEVLYGAGAFGGPPAIGSWNGQVIAGAYLGAFGGGEGNTSAIGVWNGAAWEPLGEAPSVSFAGQTPFATVGTTLYAAGAFGANASVGRYNGGEWVGVGDNSLGYVICLTTLDNNLYASMSSFTGPGVVAVLHSGAWQQVGGVFDTAPVALGTASGSLFAGGSFSMIGGVPIRGIARWDGQAWEPVGSGTAGPVLAVAGLNTQIVAGGDFPSIGERGFSRFAYFDCLPSPPCRCDTNADGMLTSQDFFDFLAAFFAGSADFNGDGSTSSQDFFDFLACFFQGC